MRWLRVHVAAWLLMAIATSRPAAAADAVRSLAGLGKRLPAQISLRDSRLEQIRLRGDLVFVAEVECR